MESKRVFVHCSTRHAYSQAKKYAMTPLSAARCIAAKMRSETPNPKFPKHLSRSRAVGSTVEQVFLFENVFFSRILIGFLI